MFRLFVVFVAAFAAGAINSVSGGGTLITFPALVWAGFDPLIANTTNTVAIWPGALSSMAGYRRELRAAPREALLLALPSLAGGIIGAVLLLITPSRVFGAIVPWLIFAATGLFALQELINGRTRKRVPAPASPVSLSGSWLRATAGQLVIGVYGGYFGAGMGILMLAMLGMLGYSDLHQMLGLRNFYGFCINGIAAIYFVARGWVSWGVALLMIAGQVAGGYGGAVIARRMGRTVLRRLVVIIGVSMGTWMLFQLK